jgi:glutamyl-tRNA synthetase
MREQGIPGADDPRLEQAVAAAQEKMQTLSELPDLVGFAFRPVEFDEAAWQKVMKGNDVRNGARDLLARTRAVLEATEPFDEDHLEIALRALAEELGTKPGAVFQPLRVALTGRTVSAGIFESLALLGKEESLARVDAALARL